MFNLDPGKLLVIALLAVVLLGPEKLPDAARQIGLVWRAVTRWRERMEAEVRSTLPDLPTTPDLTQMLRSPSTLLNHWATFDDVSPTTTGDEALSESEDMTGAHVAASVTPGNEVTGAAECAQEIAASRATP